MWMGRFLTSIILLSLFILPALSHPVLATISHATCSNTTLSTNYVYVVNDTGSEINKTSQTLCQFGCNANSGLCNPDPFSSDATSIFYFLFPIISFVLLYYANMLKSEDWPIHIYLTAVAFLFLVLPLGILSSALPDPVANLYQLMLVSFFIVMVYYLLRVFVFSYKQAGGKT